MHSFMTLTTVLSTSRSVLCFVFGGPRPSEQEGGALKERSNLKTPQILRSPRSSDPQDPQILRSLRSSGPETPRTLRSSDPQDHQILQILRPPGPSEPQDPQTLRPSNPPDPRILIRGVNSQETLVFKQMSIRQSRCPMETIPKSLPGSGISTLGRYLLRRDTASKSV